MKIDNRILIIPAMPFALLILARVMWWVAGADWSEPEVAAGMCLIFGFIIGGAATGIMVCENLTIGHTRIGGKSDE
jgi:hypothetical protein